MSIKDRSKEAASWRDTYWPVNPQETRQTCTVAFRPEVARPLLICQQLMNKQLAELMAQTKQLFEESVAESGYTGDLFKLEVMK